jgi:Leucine-rich repeat (LRR) protein
MKKLLPLLLLFTGMVNAQIVTIPDANFKAALLSSSPTLQLAKDASDQWIAIDANNDGEIQLTEAQAIKFLIVPSGPTSDITGIDSFSNLEALSVQHNQITSVDLNSLTSLTSLSFINTWHLSSLQISSLTNLTELYCISLPNLTSLDVSNLTSLTKLTCIFTWVNNLNVAGLTNLTELNCSGNLLTTLNVSGLINLTRLDCSMNQIANLNVNNLLNLTDLNCSQNLLTNLNGIPNVSKLNCQYNKLTTFNVGGLTNLTDLNCYGNEITTLNVNPLSNLIKLDCGANKIITLNVSGLANLKSIFCSYSTELSSVTLTNLTSLEDFIVTGTLSSSGYTNIISQLTSLNLSGLPNLKKLNCSIGKLTSLNLSNLISLTELDCTYNNISSLNLVNLPNLEKLSCTSNPILSLDASTLTNLVELNCGFGHTADGQVTGLMQNLNVVGLSHLKKLSCVYNQLTSLDLTGLVSLESLTCDGVSNGLGLMTSLNVNNLTNLKFLSCTNQQLTSLNVSNLVNLEILYCSYNHITNLDLTGLINLVTLDYSYNQLANLNLVNLPGLITLNCSNNYLVTLNVLNLTNLRNLYCPFNQLTTLNLSGLSNLQILDYSYNQLALSDVSGLSTNLKSLACSGNNLTSLDVTGLTSLENLSCNTNELTSLDLSTLPNLLTLDCSVNHLPSLDVSNLINLQQLNVGMNLIPDLNITGLNGLTLLFCGNNPISSLDLSNHIALTNLDYSNCFLPNLDISFLTNLNYLSCFGTQTTAIDLSNLPNLTQLDCSNNLLTTLDTKNCSIVNCGSNQLTTLYIKNGINEQLLEFSNNPTLEYICADSSQLESLQTQLNGLGMTTTVANSYCTFTPGGPHNTINGITIFDADNNGCDVTDVVNPFIRLDINNNSEIGSTVTNINGSYNYYSDAGNYTISPNVENPTWFDFSPASANFSFVNNNNNISTQNFCVAAIGTHNDIEVVFAPLEPARPGFYAKYKVVYKNKGNQMHSGTVNLTFDDARTDLVNSVPAQDATGTNSLSWNYINLMPFENRSIIITLELNQPGDTPALNNGDILNFTASITPVVGDELPNDNQYTYNQTVVGSYDPNSIECLEGDTVSPIEIGNYLHYAINFENLGNFYAENIVVRSEIDESKYDISTLQVMNTSHASSTRITGNVVEFVFQGINLAAAAGTPPVGGHGDVLFKIKTKDNLAESDTVLQRAGIYFDYNFPVATNDAETTFAALSNPIFEFDNSVKIHPNPTNSIINIDSDFIIDSIELYDIQGRILETHFETTNTSRLDISSKSKGVYFLKIKTEKGSKVEKVVKE